jgi:phage gpG-like protein
MPRFGLSIPRGRRTVTRSVGGLVGVRFTGIDLDDYALALRGIARRGQNMQPAFEEWGRYLVEEHVPEQFARQGTPKRWARLSPTYAAWKRRKYGNLPILVRTGGMRAGFQWKAHPRSMQIVNLKKYWQYHQFGTRHMPARPVLQVRKQDQDRLAQISLAYLIAETSGAGL